MVGLLPEQQGAKKRTSAAHTQTNCDATSGHRAFGRFISLFSDRLLGLASGGYRETATFCLKPGLFVTRRGSGLLGRCCEGAAVTPAEPLFEVVLGRYHMAASDRDPIVFVNEFHERDAGTLNELRNVT